MATYRFELSWSGVMLTFPWTPSAATVNDYASVAFTGRFLDNGGTTRLLGMQLDLLAHSFGAGPTYEYQTQQQDLQIPSPGAGPVDLGAPSARVHLEASGQAGAAFLTGPVTLSVTLDDGASMATFVGPLASTSYTFAALGWASGAITVPHLQFMGIGMAVSDTTQDHGFSVGFYNYYLSQNGVRIEGAQLGTIQPGAWTGGTLGVAPWIESSGFSSFTASVPQTEASLGAGMSILHPLTGLAALYRQFGGGLGDVEAALALLCHSDTGALVYARVIKQQLDAVEIGSSDDNGHTWSTVLAGKVAGRAYRSPSLSEGPDGSINCFVSERASKLTTWLKSGTRGRTWTDAGILLPLLPWTNFTHPKVFTLPTGFFLVSYNSASHWFLAVYDGGQAGSFGIKTTDMGANIGGFDTYPGMHAGADGTIYTVEASSGINERLTRSTDHGVDWADLYSAPLGSKNVVSVSSRYSPFIWKVWQDSGNNLLGAAAVDGGGAYLHPPLTIIAGIAPQYVGLAILPKGQAIEAHQVYNAGTDHWDIFGFQSTDLGVFWGSI